MGWPAAAFAAAGVVAEGIQHAEKISAFGEKIYGSITPRISRQKPKSAFGKKRAKVNFGPRGLGGGSKKRKVSRPVPRRLRLWPIMKPLRGNKYWQRRKPTNAQIAASFPRRIHATPTMHRSSTRAARRRRNGIAARASLTRSYRSARNRRRSTRFARAVRTRRSRYTRPKKRGYTKNRRFGGIRSYITGLPLSQTIWVKTYQQIKITVIAGQWGVVPFELNNLLKPLAWASDGTFTEAGAYKLTEAALAASHRIFAFQDKAGSATELAKAQPNGYDTLMPAATGTWLGRYNRYDVLQSNITIQMIPADPQAPSKTVGGFLKGTYLNGQGGTGGGSVPTGYNESRPAEKWANVGRSQVMLLDSYKMLDNGGQMITVGGSNGGAASLGSSNRFHKKWFKKTSVSKFKRSHGSASFEDEFFHGTFDTAPVYKPMCYFALADLGPTTGTDAVLSGTVTVMHKIRLFTHDNVIPPVSVV